MRLAPFTGSFFQLALTLIGIMALFAAAVMYLQEAGASHASESELTAAGAGTSKQA